MDILTLLPVKAQTVVKSATTYIMAAAFVLQIVIAEAGSANLPLPAFVPQILLGLTAIVAVIRRVTVVPPADRGLDPVDYDLEAARMD